MQNKTLGAVLGIYATAILFNIALWGGIIWAAVHFIRKFW
jgi:hypothetical protein